MSLAEPLSLCSNRDNLGNLHLIRKKNLQKYENSLPMEKSAVVLLNKFHQWHIFNKSNIYKDSINWILKG